MRRMEKITGRTDDMMIVRGVNVFPTQVEEHVLAETGLAPYFQCVLTRPGRLDELTVLVESRESLAEPGRRRSARALVSRIKDRIGTTAAGRGARPRRIERSIGKARRVVDEPTSRLIAFTGVFATPWCGQPSQLAGPAVTRVPVPAAATRITVV